LLFEVPENKWVALGEAVYMLVVVVVVDQQLVEGEGYNLEAHGALVRLVDLPLGAQLGMHNYCRTLHLLGSDAHIEYNKSVHCSLNTSNFTS
jgi:hypothetical protein